MEATPAPAPERRKAPAMRLTYVLAVEGAKAKVRYASPAMLAQREAELARAEAELAAYPYVPEAVA